MSAGERDVNATVESMLECAQRWLVADSLSNLIQTPVVSSGLSPLSEPLAFQLAGPMKIGSLAENACFRALRHNLPAHIEQEAAGMS